MALCSFKLKKRVSVSLQFPLHLHETATNSLGQEETLTVLGLINLQQTVTMIQHSANAVL